MILFTLQTTIVVLLGYIALDTSTHLTKDTMWGTVRRVFSVSSIYLGGSLGCLAPLYTQISESWSALQGAPFTAVWIASLILILLGTWMLYHRSLKHSRLSEEDKASVVVLVTRQLNSALTPFKTEVKDSNSALESRIASLERGSSKLSMSAEGLSKAVDSLNKTTSSMAEKIEFRREQFNKVIDGYNAWVKDHKDDQITISNLQSGVGSLLERIGIVTDILDEFQLPVVEPEMRKDERVPESSNSSTQSPPTARPHGKLTYADGVANREKGNRAQLEFSETVLKKAGKQHVLSFREGEPDFVFFRNDATGRRIATYVGAFKALTLSLEQGGTKQRRIYKSKMLAEVKAALKYNVPLLLFVKNLQNGRIWPKVLTVEELKNKFDGITTPLMLVENEPASEKACSEALNTVMQLL